MHESDFPQWMHKRAATIGAFWLLTALCTENALDAICRGLHKDGFPGVEVGPFLVEANGGRPLSDGELRLAGAAIAHIVEKVMRVAARTHRYKQYGERAAVFSQPMRYRLVDDNALVPQSPVPIVAAGRPKPNDPLAMAVAVLPTEFLRRVHNAIGAELRTR